MFLLCRPSVLSQTAVQGDPIASELVKAVPGHALLLLLHFIWSQIVLLESTASSARALRILRRPLKPRLQLILGVEAGGAVFVHFYIGVHLWSVWLTWNLKGQVVDGAPDQFQHLFLSVR